MNQNQALVVESNTTCRAKLKRCLQRAFPAARVDTAACFSHGRLLLEQSSYYIGLIAADLPDGSGFELMAQARQGARQIHVVATGRGYDTQAFSKALRAGAEGFVFKEQTEDELATQLHGLSRGQPPLSPPVVRELMRAYARAADEPAEPQHDLTPKELEVLAALGKGMRVKDVARNLQVSENTVRTHVKHLYAKLNIASRAEAARAAVRLGLI